MSFMSGMCFSHSQRATFFSVLCLAFLALLAACATITSRQNAADEIAEAAGFSSFGVETSSFMLQAYGRFLQAGSPLVVYIEGDGLAWISRTQPSYNPTPIKPLMLSLASIDGSKNVVYLARPCQYISMDKNPKCEQDYWLGKRFAPEVIDSMNEAISAVVAKINAPEVHLVGYSGGGAVAALIAARRDDVKTLRTIAGYLDHVALNRARKVSPLGGSLDPMRISDKLSGLPQIHYVGANDKIIPSWVAKSFILKQAKGCSRMRIENASHEEGWESVWRRQSMTLPLCQTPS